MRIFHICRREDWLAARQGETYVGSEVARADGYLHFSTRPQLAQSLERHFAGQSDLVLLAVESDGLVGLRWEESRRRERFPHLYGVLPLSHVRDVIAIADGPARALPDLDEA